MCRKTSRSQESYGPSEQLSVSVERTDGRPTGSSTVCPELDSANLCNFVSNPADERDGRDDVSDPRLGRREAIDRSYSIIYNSCYTDDIRV